MPAVEFVDGVTKLCFRLKRRSKREWRCATFRALFLPRAGVIVVAVAARSSIPTRLALAQANIVSNKPGTNRFKRTNSSGLSGGTSIKLWRPFGYTLIKNPVRLGWRLAVISRLPAADMISLIARTFAFTASGVSSSPKITNRGQGKDRKAPDGS